MKLQKLSAIHLYSSDIDDDFENQGSIKLVIIFISIAVCILIIACINYISLSISNVTKRSKDVGIRMIHGAHRSGIVWLYIGESVTLSALSLLFAIFISGAIQPLLLDYAGFYFNLDDLNSLPFLIFSACVLMMVSVISGSIISGYVIKYKIFENINRSRSSWLKGFSTSGIYTYFQFFISVILIICTIFIFRQLTYMQKTDMGFNPHLIITMPIDKTFSYS